MDVAVEVHGSMECPIPTCHRIMVEHQEHWMIIPRVCPISLDLHAIPEKIRHFIEDTFRGAFVMVSGDPPNRSWAFLDYWPDMIRMGRRSTEVTKNVQLILWSQTPMPRIKDRLLHALQGIMWPITYTDYVFMTEV
jgi:hypothetical protein